MWEFVILNKKNIRQIKSDVILLPRNNISVTSYVMEELSISSLSQML